MMVTERKITTPTRTLPPQGGGKKAKNLGTVSEYQDSLPDHLFPEESRDSRDAFPHHSINAGENLFPNHWPVGSRHRTQMVRRAHPAGALGMGDSAQASSL